MSEACEYFGAMHELAAEKRRQNKLHSTRILEGSGVPFESKSDGVHLIVMNRWDYWPSTGLFIDRTNQKRGRGVRNLIRLAKGVK